MAAELQREGKKQRQEIVTDKRQKQIIIAELILELVEKDLKIISIDILIVKKTVQNGEKQ